MRDKIFCVVENIFVKYFLLSQKSFGLAKNILLVTKNILSRENILVVVEKVFVRRKNILLSRKYFCLHEKYFVGDENIFHHVMIFTVSLMSVLVLRITCHSCSYSNLLCSIIFFVYPPDTRQRVTLVRVSQ